MNEGKAVEREWFPVFLNTDLYAMKWRNRKMRLVWQERMYDVPQRLGVPRLINLCDNPQERIEEALGESSVVTRGWVAHAMFQQLAKFQASLKKDPLITTRRSKPAN